MKNYTLNPKRYTLTIGWLYPDLMSTYGDRGNIIALQKRAEWRGIDIKIERISLDTKYQVLSTCDLLFMGGAQDTQQEIVNTDLFENKGKVLREKIENGTPGLYICGAYQFLGKYYLTADHHKLPGLEIFPVHTENPGENVKRLIGNIIIKPNSLTTYNLQLTTHLVGFENHGGRTYLEDKSMAFAKVITGHGNNGEDGTEGLLYKNSIGSYLHGPILPKNPELADFLIAKSLENKYHETIELKMLDDSLETQARDFIIKKLS